MNERNPDTSKLIANLTSGLPEIYQPIFGHEGLSKSVSRNCYDRLEYINRVYSLLERFLGRPLRALDLGCAQGFFSLSLAQRGADVQGIDLEKKNIELCKSLLIENPNLKASFSVERIESVIENIQENQYDLILGLSIFHHIIYEKGISKASELLEQLARLAGALVVEFALSEEPVYWNKYLPNNPRILIDKITFNRELYRFKTHLSKIERPLYFASNRFWLFDEDVGVFDSMRFYSNSLTKNAFQNSRRYYFSKKWVIKNYRFDNLIGETNKSDFAAEKRFLQHPPTNFPVPNEFFFYETSSEGWVGQSRIEGRVLLDLILDDHAFNGLKILFDVLECLIVLEKNGLYHNDVRSWNVIVSDGDHAQLIDYGSISTEEKDCVWPENIYLSFFIFVFEVSMRRVENPVPLRSVAISPTRLPSPFNAWAEEIWQKPISDWSFSLFYELLKKYSTRDSKSYEPELLDIWMGAIEKALQEFKLNIAHLGRQANKEIELELTSNKLSEKEIHLESMLNKFSEEKLHLESMLNKLSEKETHLESMLNKLSEKETHLESMLNKRSKPLIKRINQFLRQYIKSVLRIIYTQSRKSLLLKKSLRTFESIAPLLFKRLLNIGKSQYFLSRQNNHVKQSVVASSAITYPTGQPLILFYVDHTCQFPHNTGIQQLTRQCLIGLCHKGYTVVPVKWNDQLSKYQTIHVEELSSLTVFCNDLTGFHKSALLSVATNQIIEDLPTTLVVNSIFVPEVTHINLTQRNVTTQIIREAKRLKIKISFIFYDDTPLRRSELKKMRETHANYMRDIHEADFIFPISNYSKNNLLYFWKSHHIQPPASSVIKTIYLGNSFASYEQASSKTTQNCEIQSLESPFVLSVGSITEHKNQLTLISAFIKFKDKHPDCNLKLLLAGHVSNNIEHRVYRVISKRHDIKLIESPSNETIVAAYQNCLFCVFPSLMEGFGLPIIESLYFNKPCITANFGAMAEISTGGGCLNVDTCSVEKLAEAVERLVFDQPFFERLKAEATIRVVEDGRAYAEKISEIWSHDAEKVTQKAEKKRIFWLGMHKILVKTELPRLRDLGFEVFNPPYLSDVADQSAHLDWDASQNTTLPSEVFDQLSKTDFFYIDQLDKDIAAILNKYFDYVVVTISLTWLAPILRQYQGTIIYRVYGQSFSITDEFHRLGLEPLARDNPNFHFLPHALEAVDQESDWLLNKAVPTPYCLLDDVFAYADSWVGSASSNGEIVLTCPNITNPYYAKHYRLLKQHFTEPFYKLYGVQLEEFSDPSVVGTLPRYKFIESFRNSACYVYTYDDPGVCYLPPIEAMVIGLPVLFPHGCLLDKYFNNETTPARFSDFDTCKKTVSEIRLGNTELINQIIIKQKRIIKRYKPSDVWPVFDQFFTNL